MEKKKVVIIGCGFGGVSAAEVLSRFKKEFAVTVIDKSRYFNFLPVLPDIIGRDVKPEHLTYPLPALAHHLGFTFVNAEAHNLDLTNNAVTTSGGVIPYDYALAASGSETNFYGNDQIRRYAYKIDDAQDAARLRDTLDRNDFDDYLVAGAGYTGIEVATNLRRYLMTRNRRAPIIMVEKGPSILGPLPEWMKQYVTKNLQELDIEVYTANGIAAIQDRTVTLTDKKVFANALLIWAAGVKTARFIQALTLEKTPQGRIKVDAYLRGSPNCFFIGDNASVSAKGTMLRMAVQFAIMQARTAAGNIIRLSRGKKLLPCKPIDRGYVIPLTNDRACGHIMGMDLKGRLPLLLHYMMCVYRSYGWDNKKGLLYDMLRKTNSRWTCKAAGASLSALPPNNKNGVGSIFGK
jgi:NADH dehydrogenase